MKTKLTQCFEDGGLTDFSYDHASFSQILFMIIFCLYHIIIINILFFRITCTSKFHFWEISLSTYVKDTSQRFCLLPRVYVLRMMPSRLISWFCRVASEGGGRRRDRSSRFAAWRPTKCDVRERLSSAVWEPRDHETRSMYGW